MLCIIFVHAVHGLDFLMIQVEEPSDGFDSFRFSVHPTGRAHVMTVYCVIVVYSCMLLRVLILPKGFICGHHIVCVN